MKDLDSVILTSDVPEYGLKRGDLGTVVLVHHGDKGYEVEFVALDGVRFPLNGQPPAPNIGYIGTLNACSISWSLRSAISTARNALT